MPGVAADAGRARRSRSGSDPRDRNIRIAPTFPDLATVAPAAEGVALSVSGATTACAQAAARV